MRSTKGLIWRNLSAHPLRTVLTALAITLGVAMVLAASIIGQAANQQATAVSATTLPIDLEIAARDNAPFELPRLTESTLPQLHIAAQMQPSGRNLEIVGTNLPLYADIYQPELANGRFPTTPNAIILPMSVALQNSLNVGDELILAMDGNRQTFIVAGRLKLETNALPGQKITAFVPLAAAQNLAELPNQVNRIEVMLADNANLDEAKSSLAQQLGSELIVTRTAVPGSANFNLLIIQAGMGIIGLIILFAAAFVILNAFAMSVTARTEEIGALRALGMKRRQILRLVLGEAFLLAVMGAGVGILLGIGLAYAILQGQQLLADTDFIIPWWGLLIAPFLGLTVTLAAAWFPARRASQVSPIAAMRPHQQTAVSHKNITSGSHIGLILLIVTIVAAAVFALVAQPDIFVALGAFGVVLILLLTCIVLLLPRLVIWLETAVRPILIRWWGTNGRLAADNLSRNPLRSARTASSLMAGLLMIIVTTGFLQIFLKGGFSAPVSKIQGDAFVGFDLLNVVDDEFDYENLNFDFFFDAIDPNLASELNALAAAGTVKLMPMRGVEVPPELQLTPGSPALLVDPQTYFDSGNYTLFEGDRTQALQWMAQGNAILLQPYLAERVNAGVGDTVTLPTPHGDVDFVVAGIGGSSFPMAILPFSAGEQYFDAAEPSFIGILIPDNQNREQTITAVTAIVEQYPQYTTYNVGDMLDPVMDAMGQLQQTLTSLLFMAVIVAALGVVNTMVINVAERRREIGMIRAVGATQRQVRQTVIAEAATLGFIAALIAALFSFLLIGLLALLFIPNGYASMGIIVDRVLWQEAYGPALRDMGMATAVSLILAPLIAALAATAPARQAAAINVVEATRSERLSLTKWGTAIALGADTLNPERQPETAKRREAGLLGRGSIRTRFVVGTAVLMLLVLWGLTAVVIRHARNYLEETTADVVTSLVELNASMIEFNLPPDADRITLEMLQSGNLDADMMLQFRSLIDEMNAFGLVEFVIADPDDIVLFGFDLGQMGMALQPLMDEGRTVTAVSETDSGQRQIQASAPIRNENGDLLGSVRLRMEMGEIGNFLRDLNQAILTVGVLILALGLALAYWATTPLVGTTRQLSAGAAQVGQGQFYKIALRRRLNVSLRWKLTAVMVILLILLVGALEQIVLPIERRKVEEVTQETLIAATEWMARMISEFGIQISELDDLQSLIPQSTFRNPQSIGQVQDLSEQMQNEAIAYTALVNEKGIIQLSDQFDLIGGEIPIPNQTLLEETEWQNAPIWRITTPLRDEESGVVTGGLQIGVQQSVIDEFLDESRTLFRLSGVIAVLAGVILAQAIGGAVAAPVQRLAADTRRVGRGDLSVQFQVNSRDELAQLAGAFNEMVAGLQEREWLRDMFGRFVSQEVAEAIRSGQVKLEGENRVVSVLFCDIRGFTARSEKSTPAEIVALLNEYLPVVVNAAQNHDGMVNKFGGDSTLVIYGAPRQMQESAYHAICTALEMQHNLAALNQRLAERGEEPIRIGVGISTGMVLAGAVGPPERQEYTVIGDTVNLASRIEALNKVYPQHGVLISGQTHEALGKRRAAFAFTDLGEIEIRGKVEAVRVWAVETAVL